MEVNFDDFFDPESQTAPGPASATEPEPNPAPAAEPVLTREPPRPTEPVRPRRRAKGAKYTAAQKKEMEQAATIEHYMTAFTAMLLCIPAVPGIYLLFGDWVSTVQGILCFAVSGLMAALFIKKVKESPKQVALRVWWGKRIPYLKQEGYALSIPYVWDLIRVDVTDKNTDLSRDKVVTKDGIVNVAASMTWHVDYQNPYSVIRYVDVGGLYNVVNIVDDPAGEGMRVHAISETSEEALNDKEGFRNQIIDSVGKTEDQDYRADFKSGGKHLILKTVGIEITQLTVPDVMLPEGAIKRRQEITNEKYDTEKENIERNHNIESLKMIRDDVGLTPNDAAEFWLISQGKLPKTTHEERINVVGLDNGNNLFAGLIPAFQMLGKALHQGQGGKEKKGGKNQAKQRNNRDE